MKIKNIIFASFLLLFYSVSFGQTEFIKTDQQFKNGQYVWNVVYANQKIAEFWPVHEMKFITKQTDPELFKLSLDSLQKNLGGIAVAPASMTAKSVDGYIMEGKSLTRGQACGDGIVYNYGVVTISPSGGRIKFNHKKTIKNFDEFYENQKTLGGSLLFLPSIYRNGIYLSSANKIEKVLVKRWTYDGIQIGIVIFDLLTTYNNVRKIILGLDRDGKSLTTHIYVLDGGPVWGQYSKEVNNQIIISGTRDVNCVTNYLIFY